MFNRLKGYVIAVIAVLAFVSTGALSVGAADGFNDVNEGDTHYEGIKALSDQGVINGYTNGDFGPWDDIERQQAALILTAMTEFAIPENIDSVLEAYKDIDKDSLYAEEIATMTAAGVFQGSDGSFDPKKEITRQQLASVLVLALELDQYDIGESVDIHLSNVSPPHQDAVQTIANLELTDQLEDYRPAEYITRGAAATLLHRAQQIEPDIDAALDSDEVMKTIKDLSVGIGPRVAGQDGEREAADYLKNRFEDYGYDDVSIQKFAIRDQLRIQLTINDEEEIALGRAKGSAETEEDGVKGTLFDAGLGKAENFTEEADGKIALIERGDISYADQVQHATEAGAIGAVIYDNTDSLMPIRPSLGDEEASIPVVGAQKADGEKLLSQMNEGEVNANLSVFTETNQTSQNVIAVKKPEGITNPEIVYITAHYDSVPFSPGANDDAAGTGVIVEMARIMQDLPTDKEIRFIAFGAEEIGLVGSKYYVSELSQEEIDRSAANFQMEMMGAEYEGGDYLAYNTVDGEKNLIWDYTDAAFDNLGYDKENLIAVKRGSSDHVPFHEAGIMAVCFNMGTKDGGLEPEYHTPHDAYENVSQDNVNFAGQVVKDVIFNYLADSAEMEIEEAS